MEIIRVWRIEHGGCSEGNGCGLAMLVWEGGLFLLDGKVPMMAWRLEGRQCFFVVESGTAMGSTEFLRQRLRRIVCCRRAACSGGP